ncbi:hypothetical protein HRI_003101100 [Hibiscus trionum]|uniref:Retrotransposon gag domain-containing protein n=1 Tax=Hibiscus trionum TaxID=183268 RepID=A0A9W7IF98_HIBTR|nr:hypothetical protein HRI_003101100 [Hibiscus trionum]
MSRDQGNGDPSRIEELEAAIAALRAQMVPRRVQKLEKAQQELSDAIKELSEEARDAMNALRLGFEDLKAQFNLFQLVVGNAGTNGRGHLPNVPEPQRFEVTHDAKALENFLFDMGQYFWAIHTTSEEDKVLVASMYLAGDAKLWWRSKFDEGVCSINTWDEVKKELRDMFFPKNVGYNVRRKLRELAHVGTVCEYVRNISALMLDVRDMLEDDKIFYFLEGLKPWARSKVQRPQTVAEAIVVAERLSDYGDGFTKRKTSVVSNGGANWIVNSGNGYGSNNGYDNGVVGLDEGSYKKVAKGDQFSSWGSDRGWFDRDAPRAGTNPGLGQKNEPQRSTVRCFLCQGPHR